MYRYLKNTEQDNTKIADQNLLTLKQQIFAFNIKQPPNINHTNQNQISYTSPQITMLGNGSKNKVRNLISRNLGNSQEDKDGSSSFRYLNNQDNNFQKYQNDNTISRNYQKQPVKDIAQIIQQEIKNKIKFSQSKQSRRSRQSRQQKQYLEYKQFQDNDVTLFQYQYTWRPKLSHKKIYDDPKFLLSMERKKLRVINGLKNSQLNGTEIHKIQPKNHKLRSKKSIMQRPRILSEPKKISQNYTHTSLNLGIVQNHRKVKTPYVNFNLHHLIKQRKKINSQHETQLDASQNQHYPKKKGSNLPYYALLKSEIFDINQKNTFDPKVDKQLQQKHTARTKIVRTAKKSQQHRINFNKSTLQQRKSFNFNQQISF